MPHVVIVGAGLSGLAVAFRLKARIPDVRLTILEARDRPGGNVGTVERDGFRVEIGPNGFLDNKPGTLHLCRDLGIADRLLAASEGSRKNRYVFVREQLHKLPGSPRDLLTTPLLSTKGKLALLAEPFRRRRRDPADESVAAFARRRLGREAADVFIDALVTGIHAGDPERLSLAAAFPRLAQFERDHGGILRGVLAAGKRKKREAVARGEKPAPQRMWSFRKGLEAIIDALIEQIGVPVTTGVSVRRVERTADGWAVHGDGRDRWVADAVVLTSQARDQAVAVADLDPALAAEMASIKYARVVVAALGYRSADASAPDGFGYIAPQNTRRDVLGVQWCSAIFPYRAPPGFVLWRALCGGANRPDMFDKTDIEIVAACHRELQLALGVKGEPPFVHVVRWPRAIPQYELGHPERVDRIETMVAAHPGLFVTGNAYRGVAMNDVTEQAEVIAGRVAGWLNARGNSLSGAARE
jgi:oxygen-dependent protoporphyrinogen oxidase